MLQRIGSEYAYLSGALRTLAALKGITRDPGRTFPDVAADLARRHGDRVALISERERMSYRDYNGRANQYARWALRNGVGKGDVVALLMPNRPEYLSVWLGVTRAGGVCALLNTNLSGPALAHCINIVSPKHVIVDASLADPFATAEGQLAPGPKFWSRDGYIAGCEEIETALARLPQRDIPAEERPTLTIEDKCLYIYTSGTTGLPKAANINHYRAQSIMFGFSAAMRMQPQDRVYDCLPLYHTSGGLIATGAALIAGGSVVLRERFSAKTFWDDIVRHECTAFQYIGELCRYLLNCPKQPAEMQHRIRLACGNGLRPDIWPQFQERFAIPRILEWYAATEGNAVFLNFDGQVGAVGRIPAWAKRRFVTEVVRFDHEREEPVRDAQGFCVKCAPGEAGEVISEVLNDPKRPNQRFEGYADRAATEKKVLRNVFKEGDCWFRSGDLMKRDALGYFYFVDRIGDTFRWKGENVATSEVSEALTALPGIGEANVYGVHVPGSEGRAGMAALVVDGNFDLERLHQEVTARLAPYARPVFLRITPAIETTSTFKQRKLDLVKEGFDPIAISDPLYFLHPAQNAYVRIDHKLYAEICKGLFRF